MMVITPTKLHNPTMRSNLVGGSVIAFCSPLVTMKLTPSPSGGLMPTTYSTTAPARVSFLHCIARLGGSALASKVTAWPAHPFMQTLRVDAAFAGTVAYL
jgi:hypothetical protein